MNCDYLTSNTIKWSYCDTYITSLDDLIKIENNKNHNSYLNHINKFKLYGFIYRITLLDETRTIKYYIGKKNFFTIRRTKVRKNKLPRAGHIRFFKKITNRKRVEYEEFKDEMNWQTYIGSSTHTLNKVVLKKEILEIAYNQRYLTYAEAKYQFANNVLEDDLYLNDNILGKFFRSQLTNTIIEDEVLDYVEDIES